MAKTLKRTIEGKRISVFAFREFWNGQISLADSKKERDTRDNNAETSSEEGLQASKELSRDGNLNGTHETTIGQDANDCPVCPVDQNSAGQQQDIKESILTNPSSSPVPCVPDVPLEKHFAQNTPLPNLLKVGNRVQYVGKNSSLARQYAGILEIHEIQGDTHTCKKPDGSLISWIEFDDLQLMEVLL